MEDHFNMSNQMMSQLLNVYENISALILLESRLNTANFAYWYSELTFDQTLVVLR